jgi:methylenetetrahydrofolate reductase (NADPH)
LKIIDLFSSKKENNKYVLSFEIFPPKKELPIDSIYMKLDNFKKLNPDFISVTYGAGGSGKDRTIEISSKIINDYNIEAMAHFTCVGHSKEEIDKLLSELPPNNIENILALRGDPPAGISDFNYTKGAFHYASELIEYIKSKNNFSIAAAYVEGHIDAIRIKDDLINLKTKVDMGVDFLITQLFFDNRKFYDFLERIEIMGITCPVTTGIMPVFSTSQIKHIIKLCGASITPEIFYMIDKHEKNPDDLKKAGIEYAIKQINDLIENGVDGIHILTMNKPDVTAKILDGIK